MKIVKLIHAAMLAIEFECLVVAFGFMLCQSLPSADWLSDSQADFEIQFSNCQDNLLEDLDVCWLYYFTDGSPEQDKKRMLKWDHRDFKRNQKLIGRLPEHVVGFKLDFQFRRKNYFENVPPKIAIFRVGDTCVPETQLTPSYWPTGDIPSLNYKHQTKLNGHSRLFWVMIAVGGVVSFCGLLYFALANRKGK